MTTFSGDYLLNLQVKSVNLSEGEVLSIRGVDGTELVVLANQTLLVEGQVIRSPTNTISVYFRTFQDDVIGTFQLHYQGREASRVHGWCHCRKCPRIPCTASKEGDAKVFPGAGEYFVHPARAKVHCREEGTPAKHPPELDIWDFQPPKPPSLRLSCSLHAGLQLSTETRLWGGLCRRPAFRRYGPFPLPPGL